MPIEIRLTRGLVAIVDDECADLVNAHTWHASKASSAFYAASNIKVDGKRKGVLMHRLLMAAPEDMFVDHINGNTLDNRLSNLRLVTSKQNSYNKRPSSTSGYLGVRKAGNSWLAIIFPESGAIALGTYPDKELAAAAYNSAAKALYGEFARLNKVEEVDGILDGVIATKRQSIERLQQEIELLKRST